jgi:peptidoglycan/LPS O-acetylase OafA/YrhL
MWKSPSWPAFPLGRINWAPIRPESGPADVPIGPLESARVQTLRGIACLLLVAFHAVGSTAASGLHVGDDSLFRMFTNLFVHIRMPLFTFLSGFVYACRPLRGGRAWYFSKQKLRRLGIPLVVSATVLYVLHRGMHHEVPRLGQMWTIFVYPYWHLWFVQALLLVFLLLVVLETVGALATISRYTVVLGISVGLYFLGQFEGRDPFGVHNATYLLPFFLWGLGAHRYRRLFQSKGALVWTAGCFVAAQGFHTWHVLTQAPAPIDPVGHRSAMNLLIGMSASLTALQLLPRSRPLERIGGASYPIYLYHPVFVAAMLFLAGTHVGDHPGLVFLVALAAGVAGPMAMEHLARRVPGGPLLLEGRSAQAAPSRGQDQSPRAGVPVHARSSLPGTGWARLPSWLSSDPH